MGLLDDCERLFGFRDLYAVLHAEKTDDAKKLKKAYYSQSLKWHPDRWSDAEDEEKKKSATMRFQVLSKAFELLADTERRACYDESGVVDEDDAISDDDFERLVKTWRGHFKKVTKEDIDEYMAKYTGSEEEVEDIKTAYERFGGNLDKILESVIGCEEERITKIIKNLIKEGTLKETKKFKTSATPAKTAARSKKAEKEAKEAEKSLKEIQKKEGGGDLRAMILARQSAREKDGASFLAGLEAKYGGSGTKGGPPAKKARK